MWFRRLHAARAAALCAAALCACSGAPPRSSSLPPVTPIMLPPAMAAAAEDALTGSTWRWQAASSGEASERYTLEFMPDGRVQVRADCNRGAGRYRIDAGGRLTLTGIALTKMGCGAGSLDAQFARDLGDVERYRVERGALQLTLRSGTELTFRR